MLNAIYTIIIYPITLIIEFVFVFADKIFKETGLSVAGVSIAISLLCLPLYEVVEKWQQIERDTVKRMQPAINKIKAVFRGDERFMILQTYYKQNHYHPIYALRGTFGILIQIPFFIAGYTYLSHLEALRGASFLFIKDLGAPDRLLSGINVLPIIMTLINCTAGAIYTKGFPVRDKVQVYGMSALFLVLLYNSPAGLVLYWTLNNVFSLLKHIYHKIQFKYKYVFLQIIIGAALLSFAVFILNFKGDPSIRRTLAAVSVFMLLLIWGAPAIKKYFAKYFSAHSVHFKEQDTKKQFLIYLLGTLILFFTVGVFIPSFLVAASPQEFCYIDSYTSPLFIIGNTVLQSAGLFLFWALILYPLFSRKVRTFFTAAICFIALSALIDLFVFPGNYGMISIEMVFDDDVHASGFETFINVALLVFVLLFLIFVFLKGWTKILIPVFSLVLFSVVSYSCYNIAAIEKSYHETLEFHKESTAGNSGDNQDVQPIVTFSKHAKNIVLIMLDRAQNAFVKYIFEETPALYKEYDGFVYYPNTVSFNGYTRVGAPPIFGGYEYSPMGMYQRPDVPSVTKHNEALLMLPRILSEEAGFSVTVCDPPYPNYSNKEDLRIYDDYPGVKALITDGAYTKQWMKENNFNFPSISELLKRDTIIYSIFKSCPVFLRRGIYLRGDWCSPDASPRTLLTLNAYSVLDWLPRLTGITETDKSAALIMVNNLTHENALLQYPEYRPANVITNYGNTKYGKENAYHVNAAALLRLAEWFEYLKKEGVYDNTRIILVADHGSQTNYVNDIGLPFNLDNLNPLLMVKDFNAKGEMKTDNTFMSTADVPSLALKDIIKNPVNPWTGNPIDTTAKEKPLYIAISGSVHIGGKDEKQFDIDASKDYYVHDNIFDPANWERVKE